MKYSKLFFLALVICAPAAAFAQERTPDLSNQSEDYLRGFLDGVNSVSAPTKQPGGVIGRNYSQDELDAMHFAKCCRDALGIYMPSTSDDPLEGSCRGYDEQIFEDCLR